MDNAMKLFFEDGKLKIKVAEEDTAQRRQFFYDIFHVFRDWSKTESYVMDVTLERQYKYVIAAAKRNGVEITQDVEDYYLYELKKDKEQAQRKAQEEQRKRDILQADKRQKDGCGWCENLEYIKGHIEEIDGKRRYVPGRHYCKYAVSPCRYRADDIEYEFECYKQSKAFNEPKAFIASPHPCAGCMYLEKAEKAWEEINKEMGKENV